MKHATEQDKGISATQSLKAAGAAAEENIVKAGAPISAHIAKLKDEDTRKTGEQAEGGKAEFRAGEGGHSAREEHPPPYTKTPFV